MVFVRKPHAKGYRQQADSFSDGGSGSCCETPILAPSLTSRKHFFRWNPDLDTQRTT